MILSWRSEKVAQKRKISVEAKNFADKSENTEELLKSNVICPTNGH